MTSRRRWALPLVPLYGAALATHEAMRAAGLMRSRRLRWPVVSVGSLSAGGAGKTPVVIALARMLRERGWGVDVLSRGYGRRRGEAGKVARVEAELPDAAERFGDEPVLIAERAGVPVWVGADRRAAGKAAEAAAGERVEEPRIHLLDDGFQHRALSRQFDLVLVTAEDLRDGLLPAGNLREHPLSLRRADALAVREEELAEVRDGLRQIRAREMPVWTLRRTLRFPAPLGVFGAGLRPLAFCGLARPAGFAEMLDRAGCGLVDTLAFPDHCRYRMRDLEEIVRVARELEATGLLTTEKDAVKLSAAMRRELEQKVGPLVVVALDTAFVYAAPVMRAMESRLGARAMDGETRGATAR